MAAAMTAGKNTAMSFAASFSGAASQCAMNIALFADTMILVSIFCAVMLDIGILYLSVLLVLVRIILLPLHTARHRETALD